MQFYPIFKNASLSITRLAILDYLSTIRKAIMYRHFKIVLFQYECEAVHYFIYSQEEHVGNLGGKMENLNSMSVHY